MDIFTIEFALKLVAVVLIGYTVSTLIKAIIKGIAKGIIKTQRIKYINSLIESGAFYKKD